MAFRRRNRAIVAVAVALCASVVILISMRWATTPPCVVDLTIDRDVTRLPPGMRPGATEFFVYESPSNFEFRLPERRVIAANFESAAVWTSGNDITSIRLHSADMSLNRACAIVNDLDATGACATRLDEWKLTARDGQRGNNFRVQQKQTLYNITFEVRSGYNRYYPWFVAVNLDFTKSQ